MRFLVILCVTGLLGGSGLWAVAAWVIEREGRQVLAQSPFLEGQLGKVTGFPLTFETTLSDWVFRNQDDSFQWQTPEIALSAASFRPDRLELRFPSTHRLLVEGQSHRLDARAMQGRASLGMNGVVRDIALSLDALELTPALAVEQTGASALSFAEQPDARYALEISVEGLHLAADLRRMLDPGATLPGAVDALDLSAVLGFAAPVQAGQPWPEVTEIELTGARLHWGGLLLEAEGTLARTDPAAPLEGNLAVNVADWRPFLALLVAAEVIPADAALMAGLYLGALATEGGTAITLPLALRRSVLSLGPFELLRLPAF